MEARRAPGGSASRLHAGVHAEGVPADPAVDEVFMRHALLLAERGLFTTTPNPRVGCVIVRDGVVAGEGWHERAGEAHAEVRALDDARRRGAEVRGATAYVTLEPCNHHGRTPPCCDALLSAQVSRVVVAMRDPNPAVAGGGIERLAEADIATRVGVLEREARELNLGYIKRVRHGMPWVRVKLAASLDGRTALENGESQWITGEAARADGHRWRARACAILTGIGTVIQDDPQLNVRGVETSRQPDKVVIDRNGELPQSARITRDGRLLLVTVDEVAHRWTSNVETQALPDAGRRVDLAAVMRLLAARGCNEVHVEAGAKLCGALLGAGLVDELLLYLAPRLLGEPARGMFSLGAPLAELAKAPALRFVETASVGDDLRIIARMGRGD